MVLHICSGNMSRCFRLEMISGNVISPSDILECFLLCKQVRKMLALEQLNDDKK